MWACWKHVRLNPFRTYWNSQWSEEALNLVRPDSHMKLSLSSSILLRSTVVDATLPSGGIWSKFSEGPWPQTWPHQHSLWKKVSIMSCLTLQRCSYELWSWLHSMSEPPLRYHFRPQASKRRTHDSYQWIGSLEKVRFAALMIRWFRFFSLPQSSTEIYLASQLGVTLKWPLSHWSLKSVETYHPIATMTVRASS